MSTLGTAVVEFSPDLDDADRFLDELVPPKFLVVLLKLMSGYGLVLSRALSLKENLPERASWIVCKALLAAVNEPYHKKTIELLLTRFETN